MSRFATAAEVPDSEAFHECLGETAPIPAIEADIAAARSLGARGTPTVIVNSRVMSPVPDSVTMAERIREGIRR
jgi:protein-disulfide isomerase